MKCKPVLVLYGLKIVSMKIEHMLIIDSVSYLPEAFGLPVNKFWYPHYFNTNTNLKYVGPIPDVSYFGVDEMGISERREFMTWYDDKKKRVFDYKLVLEKYCQDDVTVLRQACQIFRREFMEIGNIDVFLETFTIASACNKVLRKRFLKTNTIGLIRAGGYNCNINYSKKALIWLLHEEQMDGCRIMHAINVRDNRPPELAKYSVEAYYPKKKIINEILGCFWHGHTCQPFRDVSTMSGDTLAERYERTMSRLERITQAGYQVKIQWECKFDETGIVNQKPELLTHPIVEQSPKYTRCTIRGSNRSKASSL